MSFSFNTAIKQAALRVNALAGATATALEDTYTHATLAGADIDSADFPYDAFKDAALLIEGQLANAIANVGNHPWRSYFHGVTASLAHKAALPSVTSASKPIIGVWGSVYDASDGAECTEMAMDDIRAAVRNSNSWLVTPVYGFKMDGQRIFHTRTNVVIDCCFYDGTARSAAIVASIGAACILPDPLLEAMVCGITSLFIRDDAFVQQAQVYRGYYADTLNSIGRGLTSVPPKAIPGPTLIAA